MSYFNAMRLQVGAADASASNPVPVSSPSFISSASMTRPADTTPYTAGDVVGPAVTANLEFANCGGINGAALLITGAMLRIDVNAVPSGMVSFRLHLYNAAPTALADNAVFNLIEADRAKYLGFLVIQDPVDMGDTLWGQSDNINIKRSLGAGTTLYGVLQTVGGYTPASATVKTVTITGMVV